MVGVYEIRHVGSGRTYIGSSVEIEVRMNRHRWMLVENRHDNIHLQRAWNKYGESAFRFDIVEECAEKEIIEREQHWINETKSNSYNMCLQAMKPPSRKGCKLTEEHKAKISEAGKGRIHSEESREKRRNALKGKPFSDQHRANISKGKVGSKHSDLTRNKMSESRVGKRKTPTKIFKFRSPLGVEYEVLHLMDFALEHGVPLMSVRNTVDGRQKSFYGWTFISSEPLV